MEVFIQHIPPEFCLTSSDEPRSSVRNLHSFVSDCRTQEHRAVTWNSLLPLRSPWPSAIGMTLMSAASFGSGWGFGVHKGLSSSLPVLSGQKKKGRQCRGCPGLEMGLQAFAQLLTEQKELAEIQERVRKDLGEGC